MMNEWAEISTLSIEGKILGEAPRTDVDLYSAKTNIRWPDCGWSKQDGSWFSRIRYINEDGLRTTQFHPVIDPTHWLIPTPLPGSEPVPA